MNREEHNKKRQELLNAYNDFFRSASGQAVLENLERVCFYKHTTFLSGSNELELAYREGARSVYLHIQYMIENAKKQTKE